MRVIAARFVLACLFCASFLAAPRALLAQTPIIATWGQNMPGWSDKLSVNAVREGCTATPAECVTYVDNLASLEGASTEYISTPFNPSFAVSYAAQFSALSLTHPHLVDVGFDDFGNKIEDLEVAGQITDPNAFLNSYINALKSKNSNLKFGITTYEDALNHASLTGSSWSYLGKTYISVSAAVRARVEYVHLFQHYRESTNVAATVASAKALFPNAKIILGAYPYDRMDYLPCAYQGTTHCTWSQEQSFYQQTLLNQLALVKAGTVSGIEFYFGYFGDPENWGGWTANTRICNPTRYSACFANSLALQNLTVSVVQSWAANSSPTAAMSLSRSSISFGSQTVGQITSAVPVTMKNSGTAALTFSTINIAGLNGADFSTSNNCPTTLAAGAACTLNVFFRPRAAGIRSGEVIIYDNIGNQRITVSGTGGTSTGSPAVSLQYTSVYLGTQALRTLSTPVALGLKNSGTAPLAISSVTLSGTNAADFAVRHNCGTSLAAGASCAVLVYFQPSALGTRSAVITIRDNAGSGAQTIAISATGK